MTRKYGSLVLIGFLTATLLASVAFGQGPGGPGGRRGGGMGGMFPGRGGPGPMEAFMLLRVEKVQKELNITEDQYSKMG